MAGILDGFLEDDLADIQDMIEQINTQDQRAEERKRAEVAELKALEKAREVRGFSPPFLSYWFGMSTQQGRRVLCVCREVLI